MNAAAMAVLAGARWAVIDGARVPGLAEQLASRGAVSRCLFQGKKEEDLADLAPHLVECLPESGVGRWIGAEGWGESWGVFLASEASAEELRRHLRRFLMVLTFDGATRYFRYYDPRVLRVFLPTCDAEQLAELFGPIEAFLVEADDPSQALRFTLREGALATETLPPKAEIAWKGKPKRTGEPAR